MFENFHKSLKKIGEMSIKDITVKIHPVSKKILFHFFLAGGGEGPAKIFSTAKTTTPRRTKEALN